MHVNIKLKIPRLNIKLLKGFDVNFNSFLGIMLGFK